MNIKNFRKPAFADLRKPVRFRLPVFPPILLLVTRLGRAAFPVLPAPRLERTTRTTLALFTRARLFHDNLSPLKFHFIQCFDCIHTLRFIRHLDKAETFRITGFPVHDNTGRHYRSMLPEESREIVTGRGGTQFCNKNIHNK